MVNFDEICSHLEFRPESMRGRVLEVMVENLGKSLSAHYVAAQIGVTPMLGERGGETCTVKHVMAQMTLGQIWRRCIESNLPYRVVVNKTAQTLGLFPKDQAEKMHSDEMKYGYNDNRPHHRKFDARIHYYI
jgi:hypothetical protein